MLYEKINVSNIKKKYKCPDSAFVTNGDTQALIFQTCSSSSFQHGDAKQDQCQPWQWPPCLFAAGPSGFGPEPAVHRGQALANASLDTIINAVAVKLPELWTGQVRVWFAQAKAQFLTSPPS